MVTMYTTKLFKCNKWHAVLNNLHGSILSLDFVLYMFGLKIFYSWQDMIKDQAEQKSYV